MFDRPPSTGVRKKEKHALINVSGPDKTYINDLKFLKRWIRQHIILKIQKLWVAMHHVDYLKNVEMFYISIDKETADVKTSDGETIFDHIIKQIKNNFKRNRYPFTTEIMSLDFDSIPNTVIERRASTLPAENAKIPRVIGRGRWGTVKLMKFWDPKVHFNKKDIIRLNEEDKLRNKIKIITDDEDWNRDPSRLYNLILKNSQLILEDAYNMKHPKNLGGTFYYSKGHLTEKRYKNLKDKIKDSLNLPKIINLKFLPRKNDALATATIQVKNYMKKSEPHLKIKESNKEICKKFNANKSKVNSLLKCFDGKLYEIGHCSRQIKKHHIK